MFTLYISDFFNSARESDKSYMINHVVYYFDLKEAYLLEDKHLEAETTVLEFLVVGLRPAILLKKGTPTPKFFCNFCEIFKTTLFIEHLLWLLLKHFI